MHAPALEAVGQRPHDVLLPDQLGKVLGRYFRARRGKPCLTQSLTVVGNLMPESGGARQAQPPAPDIAYRCSLRA